MTIKKVLKIKIILLLVLLVTAISHDEYTVSATNNDFFKATERTAIYEKIDGKLIRKGAIDKNQEYKIDADIGGWYRIKFGTGFGFVDKRYTTPSNGNTIKNISNYNTNHIETYFTPTKNIAVYDTSSGRSVQFGSLYKGTRYPLLHDIGGWYRIDFVGRVGYVRKDDVIAEFTSKINHFEVLERTAVYIKEDNKLVRVGAVDKNQEYVRIGDTGGWHQVLFDGQVGFVNKDFTRPSYGRTIKNLNTAYKNSPQTFIPNKNVAIYDTSSGKSVQMGTLYRGVEYSLISDIGSWYRIEYLGRIGYVSQNHVVNTFTNAKYFKTDNERAVYDYNDRTKRIGSIEAGQSFPIINNSDTSHHLIDYAGIYGWIPKENTDPSTGNTIKNYNPGYGLLNYYIIPKQNLAVYDTSSGKSIKFATLLRGEKYSPVNDIGNWIAVDIGGRIGYVRSDLLEFEYVESTVITPYNVNFQAVIDHQMENGNPKSDGAGRVAATREEVAYYLNPLNFKEGTPAYFQFLLIDRPTNVSAKELNEKFLQNSGTLTNQGQAFVDVSRLYGINELYLISHTKHETSNGTSPLASGTSSWTLTEPGSCKVVTDSNGNPIIMDISPKKVYNMYGVGAYDNCAESAGFSYAYRAGWFTPYDAIVGGASGVIFNYLNRGQNTLYKMKWDPDYIGGNVNRGMFQYATHIQWASSTAQRMYNMYQQIDGNYALQFDIPKYLNQDKPTVPDDRMTYPDGTKGKVTTNPGSNLNLRSEANTSSSIIDRIPSGSLIEIIGYNNDWYNVRFNGQTGWVSAEFVEIVNLYITDAVLNYRDNAAGNIIGKLESGTLVVLELNESGGIISERKILNGIEYTWYQVIVNDDHYWVASDFVRQY